MTEPDWVRHAVWWQIYPLGFTGAVPAPGPAAAANEAVPAPGPAAAPGGPGGLRRLIPWLDYAQELGTNGIALGPIFASETHGYDTVDYFRVDERLGSQDDFAALVSEAKGRGLRVLLDGVFNHVGRSFPAFERALAGGPERAWFHFDGDKYADFEGHSALVKLNHAEPAVADHVTRVMTHWLERGADGWRLDAAYAVPREFWATVLPRVRKEFPDAWFAGEVIHGDYKAIVAESTLDTLTQYELWKAIWSSLNDGNFFELAWALDRHNGYLGDFVPLTFTGNHDVTRLATRLSDERHLAHALAVLCTVGGTPSVYYGDEQAFRGLKEDRAGGDDAVRPAFPAAPGDLAPYGWPAYRLHQDLIGLRRRHPWLHTARVRPIELRNEHLVYETTGDGERLVVALNVAAGPAKVVVPGVRRVLAGTGTLAGTAITLPPHGWAIIGDK
ncbi:alpha-amylase family glycosyl hydrolase [Actinoplanes sp. RD1]|uniref:alpha-amylase family glycosyl hydrolase n=1 Tax=Actinoplanes sp. RD1 TaxID=3064538 RepID=UPI002741CA18|nr:alpha-amylase family glycosyl hydrolase [Actinoplanes sp. RD1]